MSEDIGARIVERLAETMDPDAWVRMFSPEGLARTCDWRCEDDWIVSYTTARVERGELDGEFAVFVYKPTGPGSQSGKAKRWDRVKRLRCKTRREARERAVALFYEHSPKRAAAHGVAVHDG